jgi:glycosyltransferase involved in cell wall biosynthesis
MIMPCYNSAPYLDAMFESIMAQTYDNIELIAAYDSSTDDTLEKLNAWIPRFAERGYELKIVENAERLGITGGINKALPFFTGEYITFPDSDDYMFPDFVRVMVDALEEAPQYNWARCDNIMISDNEPDRILEYTNAHNMRYEQLGSPLCLMLYLIPRSPWRMLARADFFRRVFPKNTIYQHPSSHEVPLALPLAFAQEPLRIAKPLYKYILHTSAYTQSRHKSVHSSIPYMDSMEIVADECVEQLDAGTEIKLRLHSANKLYYLGQKAYYSMLYEQAGLAADYGQMLLTAMMNFTPDLAIPETFSPLLHWRQFFRYASNIVTGIYTDEDNDRASWERLTKNGLALYGAGKYCSEVIPVLKDLGVKSFKIWDKNAAEIVSKDGVAVTALPSETIAGITIALTILSSRVSSAVEEDLRKIGYIEIMDATQVKRALRYGMVQKYFPNMIIGKVE